MDIDSIEQHMKELQIFMKLDRQEMSSKAKEDLLDILILLGRTHIKAMAKLIGPREAAAMFNKKKTWIYDALNRPRTQLQRDVAKVIRREGSLIAFEVSDLVVIREKHLGLRNA